MTQLLSLFDAAAERDAALAQVEANAGDEWCDRAWAFLVAYLREHAELFPEELWEAGLEMAPNGGRALGPLLKRAASEGLIADTGRTRPRRMGHRTPGRVWKSLVYR